MIDRRRVPRRAPGRDEALQSVRVRTGRELTVVNVSNGGALVEGATRLLPGTHLDVHVVTRHGRILVRSRIVRASVCRVGPDAVHYQGALMFERPVETGVGYVVPDGSRPGAAAEGSHYPAAPPEHEAERKHE